MNTIYFIPVKQNQNPSLTARGFLKKIIGSDFTLSFTEHKKPYIKEMPNFHFNISHTSGAAVIAVAEQEVGIDIEKNRNVNLDVAKRFTKNEADFIGSSKTRFLEIWTRKEAFLKQSGQGISAGLDSFDVLKKENAQRLKTFRVGEYIISVCSEKPNTKFIIKT